MKIVLFGCKDTTLQVAKFLCRQSIDIHLVTISKAIAVRNDVAGYIDLSEFPEFFMKIYYAENYSLKGEKDISFFEDELPANVGFCVGWQRLIPGHVLKKFSHGVHGMHGSARDLPFGKGRSPMNWALIEGRKFFFTNLFRYTEGVDDGPVVAKSCFSVNSCDTSESLHFKNALSMCYIIKDNIELILKGKVDYIVQETLKGESYYPKRVPFDGAIDCRDDIHNIDRLIRAVAPPFYGATCVIGGVMIRIFRAGIFYTDVEQHPFLSSKFGEILEVFNNNKFLLRCSGGVLLVHEHSADRLKVSDTCEVTESPYKRFNRNVYGFFDC